MDRCASIERIGSALTGCPHTKYDHEPQCHPRCTSIQPDTPGSLFRSELPSAERCIQSRECSRGSGLRILGFGNTPRILPTFIALVRLFAHLILCLQPLETPTFSHAAEPANPVAGTSGGQNPCEVMANPGPPGGTASGHLLRCHRAAARSRSRLAGGRNPSPRTSAVFPAAVQASGGAGRSTFRSTDEGAWRDLCSIFQAAKFERPAMPFAVCFKRCTNPIMDRTQAGSCLLSAPVS